MKKLLAILLALSLVLSLAACGGNEKTEVEPENENIATDTTTSETADVEDAPSDASAETETEEKEEEEAPEKQPEEEKKPVSSPKPSKKPAENTSANTQQPVQPAAPAEKPEEKPAEPAAPAPEEKPAPENNAQPSAGTVGETLAAVWRANSGKSAEEIANTVISHSSIQFMGGVVPVEEGFLVGFDNTEIHGFSSGYMFAPAIGTIPFVGYVFELSDAGGADAFVSTLKNAANPRWNICTEAEQTIVEKSGNKVFFLMCPKSFEE